MKLRVKFKKYGPIKFIGHLDVMRYFQKLIRRAEIDVAYTTGFSPHQIMTFAAPLGVGVESNGEYMDIEVNSIISCEDVKNRMNAVTVPGIEIVSVRILPENAGNAMASVAAARYTVGFREGRKPNVDFASAVEAFLNKDAIIFIKETKKTVREIDLKPGIFELNWDNDSQTFNMLIDASSAGNIKPIQIVETMLSDYNETLMENALLITREDSYTNTGSEDKFELTSLGEIGTNE